MTKKEFLGLIPARGGSKGLPRKNLRLLGEKPLIAYSIECARSSKTINRCIISTDDPEIAEIAKNYGAEVPFLRPRSLAEDDTPTGKVILHVIDQLESSGSLPDIIVLLQPTSPLRTSDDIDEACKLFLKRETDALVSIMEPSRHPYWMYMRNEKQELVRLFEEAKRYHRRQDLPKVFAVNGAIYIATVDFLRKNDGDFLKGTTIGYLMPSERSIDIDSELDLQIAEILLGRSS
ncbi:MAG: cytidylyltransferase domain-containing protein [Candidatus Hodarchaeota archaeon]